MTALLPVFVGLVALLYASVGHAGATGYIAVMTLLGLPAQTVRPTALVLNVITPSGGERAIWAPVSAVLLACSIIVAVSKDKPAAG